MVPHPIQSSAVRLLGDGIVSLHSYRSSILPLSSVRYLFGFAREKTPQAPQVSARPAIRRYEGSEWKDEYSWLERGGSAVQQVLRQEQQHAQAWLQRCASLASTLHDQMLEVLPASQISVPERVGSNEYFVQQLPGRLHPCYMRRPVHGLQSTGVASGQQAGEVVLDLNELAAVHGEYVQVGQMKLSQCGQRVAFTLDAGDGSEAFGAFIRDLHTGQLHHLASLGGVVSLEWAADGRTLLATQPNGLGRPWRVVCCNAEAAGTGQGSGAGWALFEERDERFFVELGRTKDWSFLTINCNSKASSEVHLLPACLDRAAGAAASPRLVQARTPGLEYFVEHSEGQIYLLSNARGQEDYAVYRVPASSPQLGQEQWQLILGEAEAGGAIEDMDMQQGWLVLYLRQRGRQQVAVLALSGGLPVSEAQPSSKAAGQSQGSRTAAAAQAAPAAVRREHLQLAVLPSWALSVAAGANADYQSDRLRLLLSSPVHPEVAYDWHLGGSGHVMPAGNGMEQQQEQQKSDRQQQHCNLSVASVGSVTTTAMHQEDEQQSARYTWQQLWASSGDGTAVPLTVAQAAGLTLPGPHPCLLVVYGAYGHCLPTDYLAERMPLLMRGWVLALAHVRGGGELGRRWHAAGRGSAKAASVADLEACMDHLIAEGYTASGLVALEAHSAGALTAGALLNRRPQAVGAALLEAPFVDVLSAMSQPELPLTVHEYEEWGDPRQPQQLEQIRALCPYQTVRPACYPPLLLTCSQADLRVPYWGPLKYAARLRAAVNAAGEQHKPHQAAHRCGPILLLPDGHSGHFVHERDLYSTKSEQYAFLLAAIEGTLYS